MREISLKECPWPISVKQRFITKRSISCLGVIPVPPFCIFAGRFHHFRLFNFFCLCLIFKYLCNNFKSGEFAFSLFLLIKMPHFVLDSPFALCSVHEDFIIYNSLENNILRKHTTFGVLILQYVVAIYRQSKTRTQGYCC